MRFYFSVAPQKPMAWKESTCMPCLIICGNTRECTMFQSTKELLSEECRDILWSTSTSFVPALRYILHNSPTFFCRFKVFFSENVKKVNIVQLPAVPKSAMFCEEESTN